MEVLFTASSSPLSRLIRQVTGEPVSHCAIGYAGLVVHSNLRGLHVESELHFQKKSQIVFRLPIPTSAEKLLLTLGAAEGRGYDFGALLYLGLRALLPFLPRANLWQTTGMFLCTEWVTHLLEGREDSIITPMQLYRHLGGQTTW